MFPQHLIPISFISFQAVLPPKKDQRDVGLNGARSFHAAGPARDPGSGSWLSSATQWPEAEAGRRQGCWPGRALRGESSSCARRESLGWFYPN